MSAGDDEQVVAAFEDGESVHTGNVVKTNADGSFGFIEQDSGEENMFVMPKACAHFGNVIPARGTRVRYRVVLDEKTGRPRAEDVQPEDPDAAAQPEELAPAGGDSFDDLQGQPDGVDNAQLQIEGTTASGVLIKDVGNFGFIQQDSGEDNMFVMPKACEAFGYRLPPLGERVVYTVVADSKTGRPRAENVMPEHRFVQASWREAPWSPRAVGVAAGYAALGDKGWSWKGGKGGKGAKGPSGGGLRPSGVLIKDAGNFGFIQQDSGEDNMFVLPKSCEVFGGVLPPIGARVVYDVVTDAKTGRPRAESVMPEEMFMQARLGPRAGVPPAHMAPVGSEHTGTVAKSGDSFGFIEQDVGGERMFVMPLACAAFGNIIPPLGTRVMYEVVPDTKTGRPRAENVRPAWPEWPAAQGGWGEGGGWGEDSSWGSGTVEEIKESFGFIRFGPGPKDRMFVMPKACVAFGGVIPPPGTQVQYRVVMDSKTGRPRAEDVQPLDDGAPLAPGLRPQPAWPGQQWAGAVAAAGTAGEEEYAGEITKVSSGAEYGFIKQDSGGDNMFVMPKACTALGGVIPPLGARVVYTVVVDAKTGRPRAESVRPEEAWPGAACKGKGGWGPLRGAPAGARGRPY